MKGLLRAVIAVVLLAMFGGCSTLDQQGYIPVTVFTANYTEMYVDYTFYDTNGKNLGSGGGAKPFSKGGTGGAECCAKLPGPGQTVRVAWDEGMLHDDENQRRRYTRDVVVIGSPKRPGDSYDYVITRFFAGQKIEVEFISEPGDLKGPPSPRRDQLFYGKRMMRQMGE
jgi:hypothetical protein